jgi:hypothetical protein
LHDDHGVFHTGFAVAVRDRASFDFRNSPAAPRHEIADLRATFSGSRCARFIIIASKIACEQRCQGCPGTLPSAVAAMIPRCSSTDGSRQRP